MKMKTSSINCTTKLSLLLAALASIAFGIQSVRAAQTTIYKANTATLNSATLDWTTTSGGSTGVAPAVNEVGTFDSTLVSGVLTLGGNVTLDQLVFGSTAPAVTVGPTASSTLTLGSTNSGSGIDMSAATANVQIGCTTKFNTNVTISVASGRTLTFTNAAAISQSAGSTTTFSGADGTSTLVITNIAGEGSGGTLTAGALLKMTQGHIYYFGGRGPNCNLEIDGGTFDIPGARLNLAVNNQTFTMTGGFLNFPSTSSFGLRLAGANGVNGASQVASWTGTQSGGTNNIFKGGGAAAGGFLLGGNGNVSGSCSYTLSGTGVINSVGGGSDGTFSLGADQTLAYTTTFNLQGGKLIVSGNQTTTNGADISGYTAGAKQVFYWTGGTLVCGSYVASCLQNSAGGPYGVLTNYGGTLAPGDVGTAGKTIINGSYVATASSVLDIDINGSSPANTFQTNTASLGYDVVAVTNTAVLAGSLVVRTNGAAIGAGPFTVLTTVASGLSGNFNNIYNNRVTIANAGGASYLVTYGTASLQLSSWAALSAAWTVGNASAPAGSTVTFTDNGSVGAITNWIVNFGDGNSYTNSSSVGASTTHVYVGGSYTATLTVVASDGSTATVSQAITASSNPTVAWLGTASANWNTADLNWTNLTSGGLTTHYADGDPVVINELGSAHPTINLLAGVAVAPASAAFSNSATTYTVQGAGKITSTASLTKSLAGTTIILTTNDYTGGTTINGGTLQLGDGATATGTLGGGTIADNGALVLNPAGAASVTNVINGSGTVAINNSTVTLTAANGYNGGTTVSNGATAVISADNNLGGAGSGLTLNNGTVQVTTATAFTLSHPLTVSAGGGTLNLANTLTTTNANTGSGTLAVSAGVLQVGAAGTAGSVAGNISLAGGGLAYGRTDTITPGGTIAGSSTGSSITNASTAGGNTNTLTFADGNNTFGNILNTSSGLLNLTGSDNSTNIVSGSGGLSYSGNSSLAVSGGTFTVTNANVVGSSASSSTGTLIINGGTVNSSYANGNNGGSRHFKGNLTINSGGTFYITTDRLSMDDSSGSQALTLAGGSLLFDNSSGGGSYGFRFGNDGGSGQAGVNFTGVQTNGLLLCSNAPINLGGITAGKTASYTLSGGTMAVVGSGAGLILDAETNGPGSAVFTLTNTAKLTVLGTISGNNPNTTSVQIFSFLGGTLAANAVDMTYLRDTAADPVGTFVNAGGTLLPGDVGYPGRLTVTGNYSNAATAALGIEIGGITAASAGQETINTNRYDNVLVTGAATLAGNLNLALINGFEPSVAQNRTFTILTATNGVTGTFANTNISGRVSLVGDATRSFAVSISSTNVVLSNYQTPSPQAYFTQNINVGAAPLTVIFTNLSNGSSLTNLWSFGDGGTSISTAATVSHTYTLAGTNIVSLTVGNTLGVSTYTVSNSVTVTNLVIILGTNAQLANLVISNSAGALTLSPGFTTNGYAYSTTNAYGAGPVTVLVTNVDATATNTLLLGGNSQGLLTNEIASAPLTLAVGTTNVTVQVVSQDLSQTNNYIVAVTQLGSSASPTTYLTSLVVSNAANAALGFNPTFQTNTVLSEIYAATNSLASTPLTVTVTNIDGTATNTLLINGTQFQLLTNGLTSSPLTSLVEGSNNVTVQTVSQDLTVTNNYTVNVTLLGTNSLLSYLSLTPAGTLSPTFNAATNSYNATNTYVNNPVTVAATSADANATLALNLNGAGYGAAVTNSLSIGGNTLVLPANTVVVQVVSQDLSQTNTYVVNVLLQPSQTVPKLTNSVSGNNLVLAWPADHLGYRLLVQTGNLNKGVSGNINDWTTVAGSQSITSTNIAIIKAGVTNEYYKLVYP